MMRKIVFFFLFLFLVLSISLSAQTQRGVKFSPNVDSFPKVSFVWHSPNPEELKPSQFALVEKDSAVHIEVVPLPIDNSKRMFKNILILWEDMASHSRQSNFTRDLLIHFFNETKLSPTDCFEVAVFDRQKNNNATLTRLIGQFTSDVSLLNNSLIAYENNSRYYPKFPKSSDLGCAIVEGVSLLPKDAPSVIVVVTAGLNTNVDGSCSMETAYLTAIGAGIPIYVVKYPLAGDAMGVNSLAERTFGLTISSTDVSQALNGLQKLYSEMDERLLGRDYMISFTAQSERDGQQHLFCLMVPEVSDSIQLSYNAPKLTVGMWLKENWWVASLAGFFIIGIIVLVVFLVLKKKRNREVEEQNRQDRMQREQEERERRNRESMEALWRGQQAKELAAKDAAKRQQEVAQEERLCKLMQTKNLYPRLKCRCGTETLNFTIAKPRVTLGRDSDNDISFNIKNNSFNSQTVSSQHAEIVFNGSAFEIVNKSHSYTQGVVVNGQFYQRCTLRNGDMIGLGEAIITFYV